MRTSSKSHYALARPKLTRQKTYREPVIIEKKRYRTKTDAEIAVKQWTDGVLV